MTSVYGFPNIPTRIAVDVHNEADTRGNGDGKVSKQELTELKEYYAGIRFVIDDPNFRHQQEAVNVMIQHFGTFANNRGLPKDAMRTMDYRIGEDDHIRTNEIYAVARNDGNGSSISTYDVTGQSPYNPTPTPPRHPYDPLPPRWHQPRPPFFGGGFHQQLLMFVMRFLMGGQFPRY